MKYKIDFIQVGDLIESIVNDYNDLPDWLTELYNKGKFAINTDKIIFKNNGDFLRHLGLYDYIVRSKHGDILIGGFMRLEDFIPDFVPDFDELNKKTKK